MSDTESVSIKDRKVRQASVSVTGVMEKVLLEAFRTFEDAETPGEAYKRALCHWYYGRQQNSKIGRLDEIKTATDEILSRLSALEELLRCWQGD